MTFYMYLHTKILNSITSTVGINHILDTLQVLHGVSWLYFLSVNTQYNL